MKYPPYRIRRPRTRFIAGLRKILTSLLLPLKSNAIPISFIGRNTNSDAKAR